MILKKLQIEYFKKLIKETFVFSDTMTLVKGYNEEGKSSLYDAYCFLLWGKDAKGKMPLDFGIYTHDENGKNLSKISTVVGTFELDNGKTVVLSRTFKEKASKTQGTVEKYTYTNTQYYKINDDNSKAGEYNAYIKDNFTDAETFRILTDAIYFCSEGFDWKKRREILMKYAGKEDISKAIMRHKKFLPLADELADVDITKLTKRYKDRVALTKKELNDIPVRIDEQYNTQENYADAEDVDVEGLGTEISVIAGRVSSIINKMQDVESEIDSFDEKAKERNDYLSSLKAKVSKLESDANTAINQSSELIARKIENAKWEVDTIKNAIETCEINISTTNKRIEQVKADRDIMASTIEDGESIEFSVKSSDTACQTCGQELPNSKSVIAELKVDFDKRKSAYIKDLKHSIVEADGRINDYEIKLKSHEERKVKKEAELIHYTAELKDAQKEADGINSTLVDYTSINGYDSLTAEIEELTNSTTPSTPQSLREELEGLKSDLKGQEEKTTALRSEITNKERFDECSDRILVLEKEQAQTADKLVGYEKMLILCEQYITKWAKLKTDPINKMFKTVEFELFQEQMNGGIKEVCIPVHKGTKSNGWSQSQRARAGVEVIEVLSKTYGVKCPVWVEDAGIVFDLKSDELQVIQLIAIPKKIRIDGVLVDNPESTELHAESV